MKDHRTDQTKANPAHAPAMTDERLAEIRNRLSRVTPGRWLASFWAADDEADFLHVVALKLRDDDVATVGKGKQAEADADFIADTPTAITDLLAEVDRLREQVTAVKACLTEDGHEDWCSGVNHHDCCGHGCDCWQSGIRAALAEGGA